MPKLKLCGLHCIPAAEFFRDALDLRFRPSLCKTIHVFPCRHPMNHHLVTALGAIGLLAIGYVCGHAVASRKRRSSIDMEAVGGNKPAAGKKGSLDVEKLAARYEDFKMVSQHRYPFSERWSTPLSREMRLTG